MWNPWKRIRQLEAENAILEKIIKYERELTDQRIGESIAAHYRRIQHEERLRDVQNAMLQKNLQTMAEHFPFPPFMFKEPQE